MMNATSYKKRLWLLLLIGVLATLFGQTHAGEIFAPSPHESGVFAAQTQASTGENYDGIQYDALDSLLAANGGGRAGTEVVQRWMSQAELQATQTTGLLRGGRDGIHYATDAANTAAQRARLRLALPQTPQVRATLEVPGGAFSAPSRVQPKYDMPGGGMERTATGQIPVKILGVD
jgi:hypothetical protein